MNLTDLWILWTVDSLLRDVVAHIPKLFVKQVFHALVEDLDRGSHGTDHPTSDDALRQLQVMEAEQVHAFIEIEHAFGDVVQSKELGVAAVQLVNRQVRLL